MQSEFNMLSSWVRYSRFTQRDAFIFAFLKQLTLLFPRVRSALIVCDTTHTRQYTGKTMGPPTIKYSGFSTHLKILQNRPLYRGPVFRRLSQLEKIFPEDQSLKSDVIFGFPGKTDSALRVWLVLKYKEISEIPLKKIRYWNAIAKKLGQSLLNSEWINARELEKNYKAQEEAVAALIHQVKSPINALESSLLASHSPDLMPELSKRCLDLIARTRSIIDEYLGFLKLNTFYAEWVSLSRVLRELERYYALPLGSGKLKWSIDPLLQKKDPSLSGSLSLIFQVFQNLIDNSIKALEGKCEIFLDADPSEKKKVLPPELILRFWDSGQGPEDSIAEKIFDPFVSRFPSGHGLGLSICRRIMSLMGGAIRYQRGEEKGPGYFELQFLCGAPFQ